MNPLFFFIAGKKLPSCSPYFFNVEGPVTFVTLSKARALRARSIQRFLSERRNSCFQDGAVSSAWLVLLSARKWGLWFGDLKHVLSLHAVVRWSCWTLLPHGSVGISDSPVGRRQPFPAQIWAPLNL